MYMEMSEYSKRHPDVDTDCPVKHSFGTDRACQGCGYGIWTSTIICMHCGEENECEECDPREYD